MTDAEYLRAYVREVVEPPGYTTTAKRLLAIADRLEKIDAPKPHDSLMKAAAGTGPFRDDVP